MSVQNYNINEMSISKAFSALEEKINSFIDNFAITELLNSDKKNKIRVVFSTPFYATSINNTSWEGGNLKEGYIKELSACIPEDDERPYISVTSTENYIDAEENAEVEWTPFNDLVLDDKAMVASQIEDGSYFFVKDKFKNHCYKVVEDYGNIFYYKGDYITTTLLVRDFLKGCDKVEDADYIAHIYKLLYDNKGEELVNNICELWDGLKLKKIY